MYLLSLRLRSASIDLPPHRSQLRDNYLQLVPEIAATAAVGQYPSAWRSSYSRYAASCQLTGIEKLALPFADCSGGIVSPAGRALLFYSRVQCASPQTLRAKVYAGRHDFGDYKKAISPGSERLTRPSSSESPTEMHQGCIGPYGSLRCPASVARWSRERPDFVPLHPGVSRKSSSRSQVLAPAWRYDAAKTGYQSHSADGRPKRATVAAIPMDGGAPR